MPSSGVSRPAFAIAAEPTSSTVFAVIGDFGTGDRHEAAVARLVASWHPAFIVATGDDYYKVAGAKGSEQYLRSIGDFYGPWLADVPSYHRRRVGTAPVNAFFPVLGNHDYTDAKPGPWAYLTYFNLPGSGFVNSSGNERYYDFTEGPIHFFMLDSNPEEPDGTSANSVQAHWLQHALASSESSWNVVVDHHPPYSSCNVHHSTGFMQWPFAQWGADVVLSGHAHVYERVMRNGIAYMINGLGGGPRYGFTKAKVAGDTVRYSTTWGAQKVTQTGSTLRFEFYSIGGKLVDRFDITR